MPRLPFPTQWPATTTCCGIRDSLPAERTASSREANMAAPHYQHTQHNALQQYYNARTHTRRGKSKSAAERGSRCALAEARTSLLRSPACASPCVPLVMTASARAFTARKRTAFLRHRSPSVRLQVVFSDVAAVLSSSRDRNALHAAVDHNSELRPLPTYPAQ